MNYRNFQDNAIIKVTNRTATEDVYGLCPPLKYDNGTLSGGALGVGGLLDRNGNLDTSVYETSATCSDVPHEYAVRTALHYAWPPIVVPYTHRLPPTLSSYTDFERVAIPLEKVLSEDLDPLSSNPIFDSNIIKFGTLTFEGPMYVKRYLDDPNTYYLATTQEGDAGGIVETTNKTVNGGAYQEFTRITYMDLMEKGIPILRDIEDGTVIGKILMFPVSEFGLGEPEQPVSADCIPIAYPGEISSYIDIGFTNSAGTMNSRRMIASNIGPDLYITGPDDSDMPYNVDYGQSSGLLNDKVEYYNPVNHVFNFPVIQQWRSSLSAYNYYWNGTQPAGSIQLYEFFDPIGLSSYHIPYDLTGATTGYLYDTLTSGTALSPHLSSFVDGELSSNFSTYFSTDIVLSDLTLQQGNFRIDFYQDNLSGLMFSIVGTPIGYSGTWASDSVSFYTLSGGYGGIDYDNQVIFENLSIKKSDPLHFDIFMNKDNVSIYLDKKYKGTFKIATDPSYSICELGHKYFANVSILDTSYMTTFRLDKYSFGILDLKGSYNSQQMYSTATSAAIYAESITGTTGNLEKELRLKINFSVPNISSVLLKSGALDVVVFYDRYEVPSVIGERIKYFGGLKEGNRAVRTLENFTYDNFTSSTGREKTNFYHTCGVCFNDIHNGRQYAVGGFSILNQEVNGIAYGAFGIDRIEKATNIASALASQLDVSTGGYSKRNGIAYMHGGSSLQYGYCLGGEYSYIDEDVGGADEWTFDPTGDANGKIVPWRLSFADETISNLSEKVHLRSGSASICKWPQYDMLYIVGGCSKINTTVNADQVTIVDMTTGTAIVNELSDNQTRFYADFDNVSGGITTTYHGQMFGPMVTDSITDLWIAGGVIRYWDTVSSSWIYPYFDSTEVIDPSKAYSGTIRRFNISTETYTILTAKLTFFGGNGCGINDFAHTVGFYAGQGSIVPVINTTRYIDFLDYSTSTDCIKCRTSLSEKKVGVIGGCI